MKYISFAIPCYNSEEYMDKAIDSVLTAGPDVEIIIVNDGSSDATKEKAEAYAAKYPDIVKAITQPNGGHGEAVNTGLAHATGKYFKVVDSDDWLDEESLMKVMHQIKTFERQDMEVDMLIANYVYEKVGVKHKNVVSYKNIFPVNEIFHWDSVGHFRLDQYILMHSVIYRTQLLKDIQLVLPKHTFYVDNIYVYTPLPYVQSMYYMDVDLYRYYIGREDQSVNEEIMIRRADQQIFVTKTLIDSYLIEEVENKRRQKYMRKYLSIMMTVSSIILIRSHDKKNLEKKAELWSYLKEHDPKTYEKVRYNIFGITMNLPGKLGRKVSELCYLLARKLVGFQ